jgi:YD repeat-containing protein
MSNSKSENLYGTAYAGQAVAVIPIQVPSGRQVNHQLNLRYCSSIGLGPIGIGWNLDYKKIFKSQHDKDGNQYFLSGENGSREFRSNWSKTWFTTNDEVNPKISAWTDENASVIKSVIGQTGKILKSYAIAGIPGVIGGVGSDPNTAPSFVVEDPTGVKLLFGKTLESRSFGKDWTAFKVANISEIHYPNGENVKYRYRKPGYSDTFKVVDYLFSPPSLLDEIQYLADKQVLGRVKFTYEDRHRPFGENTLRLKTIEVFDESNALLNTYDLIYDVQDLLVAVEWRDAGQTILRTWSMTWEVRNSEPLLGIFNSGNGVHTEFRYQLAADFPDNDNYANAQVVSERTVRESHGSILTTKYSYCGGRFDATEGFIGFQKIMGREPDGHMVVTYIHMDPILRGRERLIEMVDASGNLVRCIKNTWNGSQDSNGIKSVKLVAAKTEFYENTPYQGLDDQYDYDHGEGLGYMIAEYGYDPQNHYLASTITHYSDSDEKLVHTLTQKDIGGWNWKVISEQEHVINGGLRTLVSSVEYEYDERGNQTQKSEWNGGERVTTQAEYYRDGQLATASDARGNKVAFFYDDNRRLCRIHKDGRAVQALNKYDPKAAKPTEVIDENGNQNVTRFDAQGRPVEILAPNGLRQSITYGDDPAHCYTVTRQIAPDGETMEHWAYFDGLERVVQEATSSLNGKYIITRTFFNKRTGREEMKCGPFFADSAAFLKTCPPDVPTVRYRYDGSGQLAETRQRLADGKEAITRMTHQGLTSEMFTPDGHRKGIVKDLRGRIREITEHDATTRYVYNAKGDIERIVNPGNVATEFRHDPLGHLTEISDPLRGHWKSQYDAHGNLIAKQGPGGQQTICEFDSYNRPVHQRSTRLGAEAIETRWKYDVPEIPNGMGRLAEIRRNDIVDRILEYDAQGHVLRHEREFAQYGQTYTCTKSFDAFGRETKIVVPGGVVILKTYHRGTFLLKRIATEDGSISATFVDYSAFGEPARIDYGNGTVNLFEYDRYTGLLIAQGVMNRSGEILESKTIERNPGGTIAKTTDLLTNETKSFDYDELGRLTNGFTYDKVGNILSRRHPAGELFYSYDFSGQLRRVRADLQIGDFSYDAAGNVLTGPDLGGLPEMTMRNIGYSADGLPLIVRGVKDNLDFTYDGYGQLAAKTVDGAPILLFEGCQINPVTGDITTFVNAGNHCIASLDNARKEVE